MSPSARRALAGEQGARPQDGPGNEFVAVAVWVRCLRDDRLHLLDRRCVPEIAEFGCALAGSAHHRGAGCACGGASVSDVPARRERVMSGKHHKTKPSWWRRLGRRPPGEKPRRLVAEMVDGTGVAHWVTREAFEQGLGERTGFSVVVCGRRIAGASMAAPPQRCCWGCQEARAC